MGRELPPLPEGFIAAVELTAGAEGDGSRPVRRLGVEISCHGHLRPEGEERLVMPVLIELFTSPPTLSTAGQGVLQIDPETRQVEIRDEGGHVHLVGEISPDFQSIRGSVELRNIQIMDLVCEHSQCPIELAGFDGQ